MLRLPIVNTIVLNLDRIQVVGIKPPDRNPAVGLHDGIRGLVADRPTVAFRHYGDLRVFDNVPAVAHDRGQRGDLVGVHDDFADVPLNGVPDRGARGAAPRKGGRSRKREGACERQRDDFGFELHGVSPLAREPLMAFEAGRVSPKSPLFCGSLSSLSLGTASCRAHRLIHGFG